jgi:hypothetical protein
MRWSSWILEVLEKKDGSQLRMNEERTRSLSLENRYIFHSVPLSFSSPSNFL